jgi:hypothetical protein
MREAWAAVSRPPQVGQLDVRGQATVDTIAEHRRRPTAGSDGFPSHEDPDGIEHFVKMLRSTAQRLSDDELETLKKALEKWRDSAKAEIAVHRVGDARTGVER